MPQAWHIVHRSERPCARATPMLERPRANLLHSWRCPSHSRMSVLLRVRLIGTCSLIVGHWPRCDQPRIGHPLASSWLRINADDTNGPLGCFVPGLITLFLKYPPMLSSAPVGLSALMHLSAAAALGFAETDLAQRKSPGPAPRAEAAPPGPCAARRTRQPACRAATVEQPLPPTFPCSPPPTRRTTRGHGGTANRGRLAGKAAPPPPLGFIKLFGRGMQLAMSHVCPAWASGSRRQRPHCRRPRGSLALGANHRSPCPPCAKEPPLVHCSTILAWPPATLPPDRQAGSEEANGEPCARVVA